ncbi:MAG TPA: serine protease [Rhodothermales bacterium]
MYRRISAAALTVFALVSCSARGLAAQDVSTLVATALPSVVTLVSYSHSGTPMGQGSGFVLPDGRLVTNVHVVAGAAWVEVVDSEGKVAGSIPYAEAASPRVDLAILPRLTGLGEGLPIATEPPPVGSRIVVIGSPQGLESTVSDGLVSGHREFDGVPMVQVSAPISPGSSGGPVLNSRGEVVGIAVSQLTTGQNLNFAVPARELEALMQSPPGRVALSTLHDPSELGALADAFIDAVVEAFRDVPVLEEGEPISGRLTEDDVDLDGAYHDFYRIDARAGQTISVAVISEDFDTYLGIFTEDGLRAWLSASADSTIPFDWYSDDYSGTNSALDLTPATDGPLYVVATSYDAGELGEYDIAWFYGELDEVLANSKPDGELGDRWVYAFSFDDDGAPVYVYWDRESVRELTPGVTPGQYEIWFMWAYDAPSVLSDGDEVDEIRALWQVNCRTRRMRQMQWIRYLRGEWVSQSTTPGDSRQPTPDSVGEGMYQAICNP